MVVVHDLDLVRAHFPETLLLARRPVAWGPTAETLKPENLLQGPPLRGGLARRRAVVRDRTSMRPCARPRHSDHAHDHHSPGWRDALRLSDRALRRIRLHAARAGRLADAVAGACPVGVFLMLRRMSLAGDAMAHAILPGAAAGFLLYGLEIVPMTIGGLIAGVIVALGAGAVSRFTIQKEDASMAAFYLISLALGVLIVSLRGSSVDLMHVLFGTVLALNDEALTLIAAIAGIDAAAARDLLAGAGRRMPRSAVPALGQPARHAGAFHLPRPRRAQSRRRLPGARHAAVGRPDDAARRRRPLLDQPGRADVRAGAWPSASPPASPACCCPTTPPCPPARRSSCRPASSISPRSCSAPRGVLRARVRHHRHRTA